MDIKIDTHIEQDSVDGPDICACGGRFVVKDIGHGSLHVDSDTNVFISVRRKQCPLCQKTIHTVESITDMFVIKRLFSPSTRIVVALTKERTK
jgi:hypothetical protein